MKLLAAFVPCVLLVVPAVAQKPMQPAFADWSAGWKLTLQGDGSVGRVELSEEVYRQQFSRYDGDVDLALYAPNGDALPFRYMERQTLVQDSAWEPIPLLEVVGDDLQPDVVRSLQTFAESTTEGKQYFSVSLSAPTPVASDESGSEWYLDVRGKRYSALRLKLDGKGGAIGSAKLAGSRDMRSFVNLGEAVGIADLSKGDFQFRNNLIPLRDSTAFLRLEMRATQGIWILHGVEGLVVRTRVSAPIREVLPARTEWDGEGWCFITDGSYPVEAVAVDPMSVQTWARLRVDVRNDTTSPWQSVAEPSVGWWRMDRYQTAELSQLQRGRYWRVVPIDGKASVGDASVALRLRYRPDQLEFPRGGYSEVKLAAGLHPSRRVGFHQHWNTPVPEQVPRVQASLGPLQVLAGNQALTPLADSKPWFLWGALVLAFSGLVALAWKVWKDLRKVG